MRLLRAPWWLLALLAGAVFGTCQFLVSVLRDDRSLAPSAIDAAIGGIIFGLLMGLLAARTNRRYLAAQGPIPRDREAEARRAVTRGPVPTDREVREAAARIADFRLRQLRRTRIWGPLVLLAITGSSLWLAVTDSPWWLLESLVFAGLLAYQLWLPGHLRRRKTMLESDAG